MKAIKSLGGMKYGGYGIVFGSVDLVGQYFTKDTDLGFSRNPVGMPVYYGHSQDTLKGKIGSVTDYDIDDIGVWFEFELDKSNKYLAAIEKLTSQKRMGLSSGALSHTVTATKDGKITTWDMGELSLTVSPCEPETLGIEFKSGDTIMEDENQGIDYTKAYEELSEKVDTLLELWSTTKDVKAGTVGGGTKENEGHSFGGWLKAVKMGDTERIMEVYNAHPANATKVLNTGTGSEGQYTVPTQFVNSLMAMMERTTIVRGRATVQNIPFGGCEIPGIDYNQTWVDGNDPNLGGLALYWTAEGAQDTQSEPEFRQIGLNSHEATTSVPVTNKLLDNNAIGLEQVLMRLFSQAVGYTEDWNFIRGNGVGKPQGVLNATATLTSDVTATGITVEELSEMYVKLLPECEDTAIWLVHPLLFSDIMSINADSSNTNPVTFLPDINGRIQPLIFGIPVVRTKVMPGNYSSGGLALVDFQKYIIGDDLNMEVAVSEHAEFRKRRTLWRCTIRVDGQPLMNASVPLGPTADERGSAFIKSSVAS
jgi:HK97 family phage major capsid protein